MSRLVSLATMVATARRRADMQSSTDTFRADADVQAELQQSAQDFWDLLIRARGANWAFAQTDLTTTPGTAYVALPSDFLELVKVGWVASSGSDPYRLSPMQLDDEWLPDETSWSTWETADLPRYALRAQQLWLTPVPSAAYTLRMQYVPRLGTLTDGAPAVQLEGVHGWEDWVCWDVAAKLKASEESDVAYELSQRDRVEERILHGSTNRDQGTPHRVQRVRGRRGR